jgi:hypothetical protein
MRVHRNLHNAKRGGPQWTVTARGRVVEYLADVHLAGVTTRIQPAGAARCHSTGVRSVCAFFDGERVTDLHDVDGPWLRVTYDPRKHSDFMANGERFNVAAGAWLRRDGSTVVLAPRWV